MHYNLLPSKIIIRLPCIVAVGFGDSIDYTSLNRERFCGEMVIIGNSAG